MSPERLPESTVKGGENAAFPGSCHLEVSGATSHLFCSVRANADFSSGSQQSYAQAVQLTQVEKPELTSVLNLDTYPSHSFIHSFIHLLIHTFAHSFSHTHSYTFTHSFILHSHTHSFIHSPFTYTNILTPSAIHSLTHSFIPWLIHTVIHSSIHTHAHSLIHSLTHFTNIPWVNASCCGGCRKDQPLAPYSQAVYSLVRDTNTNEVAIPWGRGK